MSRIISLILNLYFIIICCFFFHVALDILPNDSKALFRRCQGQEKLGRLESAFRDARTLIHIEPKVLYQLIKKEHDCTCIFVNQESLLCTACKLFN